MQFVLLRISDSPFELHVQGAPDASKVRVAGPGIDHGILARYHSRFTVETRGAGAGQLTVRIRGPKGRPQTLQLTDWDMFLYLYPDCGSTITEFNIFFTTYFFLYRSQPCMSA